LSTEQETFKVDTTKFIDVQYPVTPLANGSDTFIASDVTYIKPVSTPFNVTTTETDTKKETTVVIWALVLYVVLLLSFTLLAIGFVHRMRQEKAAAEEKQGSILYDGVDQ